jgi:hypothetical protein
MKKLSILMLMSCFLAIEPASACDIPRQIQIVAADQCAVMDAVTQGWRDVLKAAWFTSQVNEMFYGKRTALPTENLADMGPLRSVGHPGTEFYSAKDGVWVYGYFEPGDRPELHFAEGTLAVIRHEMGHWFYWKYRKLYGEATWHWVGHQVESDPHWDALKAIERMYYGG